MPERSDEAPALSRSFSFIKDVICACNLASSPASAIAGCTPSASFNLASNIVFSFCVAASCRRKVAVSDSSALKTTGLAFAVMVAAAVLVCAI